VLSKNPYYWDFENVKLDGIEISIIRDPHLAFQKYEKGALDWIRGPFSLIPFSIAADLKYSLQRVDTQGVSWLYCNLNHPLLSSAKIRKALSYALDREEICKKIILDPIPLKTQLPNQLSLLHENEVCYNDNVTDLFEEGLEEIKCSRSSFSELTLYHSHIPGQKELTTEVQQQWQKSFGINIQKVEETWNTLSHQLDNRLIHFASCYRHPYYFDAMYFFQMFYDARNIHNAFGWHNEKFNNLIDLAQAIPEDRSYLRSAEAELFHQMPVIPIHTVSYHYLARSDVGGIYFCHSGDVDFKWIYFQEKK